MNVGQISLLLIFQKWSMTSMMKHVIKRQYYSVIFYEIVKNWICYDVKYWFNGDQLDLISTCRYFDKLHTRYSALYANNGNKLKSLFYFIVDVVLDTQHAPTLLVFIWWYGFNMDASKLKHFMLDGKMITLTNIWIGLGIRS